MLNVESPYHPLLGGPAYTAIPRARAALETHNNELMKLGGLRKAGNNEEVEVTTPVIITWNNEKARIFGAFRAVKTYIIPDRYLIPRTHKALTQLCKKNLSLQWMTLKVSIRMF
ncbi:hypothetical protein O181_033989 [Austropuccinia psidii MF-1]|uniref:Uncharacterized protein n=1 Tax=Austropuccinia psidii MF-1 TaxID=1389203 RepID=A0A9Q3H930_9BASI|nr:hypothetical protein [Austropuccinia psidii MF-1]